MTHFNINKKTKDVYAEDSLLLKGRKGFYVGEGMAFFHGEGNELIVVNTKNGRMRTFVDVNGNLKVEDKDIDYEAVHREHEHYCRCADSKRVEFGGLRRWNDFKDGLCALCWTTYPDGRYFADEDGFGGEDNDEESLFCIINTSLEIVAPFRPEGNVAKALQGMRDKK